jgi:hypothetical protein
LFRKHKENIMDNPIEVVDRLAQSAETGEVELGRTALKEATPDNADIKLFTWSYCVLEGDSLYSISGGAGGSRSSFQEWPPTADMRKALIASPSALKKDGDTEGPADR